jgi:tetratricopeptide (TPR) repeat protein
VGGVRVGPTCSALSMDTSIQAIGSRAEKGRALERLTGAVWAHLGFRDIRFNTHATGEEIDVIGTHVVSGEILKGQCKAHEALVDTTQLRLFLGDVVKDRGANTRTTGVFVSLSGFTGTAWRWYEELSEDQRNYFKLVPGDDFIAHLVAAGVVLSFDAILSNLRERTGLDVQGLVLLVTERGPYWFTVMGDAATRTAYYTILAGNGGPPREEDIEYINSRMSPPDGARLVKLRGRSSLVRSLLKDSKLSVSSIPERLAESPEDVSVVLASLEADGLIIRTGDDIVLREETDSFIQLVKMSIEADIILDFMLSDYYRESIPKLLVPLVEARYRVRFDVEMLQKINELLALSPRALKRAVLADAEMYRNTDAHLTELNPSKEQDTKWRGQMVARLLGDLTRDLLLDHEEGQSERLEDRRDIIAAKLEVAIGLASRSEAVFVSQYQWYTMRAQLEEGASVQAGQLMSVTGPGPILYHADALQALQDWDQAVETYTEVMESWPDTDEFYAAKHNIGVVFLRKGKYREAVEVLKEVLDHNAVRKYALGNLARAYSHLGDRKAVEEMLSILRDQFPDEPLHQSLPTEVYGNLERLANDAGATSDTT